MPREIENTCNGFQQTVSLHLIRHRSVLDVMTKYQDACSRVNRALAKAVTTCGCLKVTAGKQELPADASLSEMSEYVQTHLEGHLCPNCAEVIEEEMGKSIFFMAAICTLTGLDLAQVIHAENDRISTLGFYSLT
ncbi:MAG: DUF1573 domain-containing protein [Actinobacteria bacterium]|nr:DUF1573 domain-containing protein [Actinomycetota bacterium]MBU1942132.1 DUF1573 domain-containing protein [Actinomycetota bacterium]MBU2686684.1 DUF1573 domain-containing protein [Actinomycetota bacterium]